MTSSHRSTALRLLIAAGAVVLTGAATAAPAPAPAATQTAAVDDWRTIAPENLLVIDTNKGRILVEVDPRAAPAHAERIRTLANRGFYDGLKFHRVMRNFMAQTGDPLGTGEGGSDLPDVPGEFAFRRGRDAGFAAVAGAGPGAGVRGVMGSLPIQTQPDAQMFVTADMKVDAGGLFCPGVLGMARANDPNSANSQFFLMTGNNTALNGTYTAFGRVLVGLDVVKLLKIGSDTANGSVVDPDYMTHVRMASAMPEGERPVVRAADPRGAVFAAEVEKVRAARGVGFNICDVTVPAEVVGG